MKLLVVLTISMLIAGCAYLEGMDYVDILETQRSLVSQCASLGVVSETADAGNPFTFHATQRMRVNIRKRAAQLGATHIVWLHQTPQAAAAEAFRCSAQ